MSSDLEHLIIEELFKAMYDPNKNADINHNDLTQLYGFRLTKILRSYVK